MKRASRVAVTMVVAVVVAVVGRLGACVCCVRPATTPCAHEGVSPREGAPWDVHLAALGGALVPKQFLDEGVHHRDLLMRHKGYPPPPKQKKRERVGV